MTKLLNNLVTTILVICAVLVTVAIVRREFFPQEPPVPQPRQVKEWRELAAAGHRLGPADAPVVVVEFSDFQCPFCAAAARDLRELRQRYPDQVALVYRHFPLTSIHPHARAAAVAAECAAEQDRFKAYHDLLFEYQDEIGLRTWTDFAEEAGVHLLDGFSSCLDAERASDRVTADSRAARRVRLRATSSVIINGLLLPGTPTYEILEAHVDSLLALPNPA